MTKLQEYQMMFERATATGKPNRDKSLAGWHERASMTRRALLSIKAKYQADLDELKETYAPKVFAEKRKKTDSDYDAVVEIAKKKITDDLENVLEGKKARFDECSGAPTDENLRLLNVLNMRDSLTPAEIATVSGKFYGNIQCLRLLRDIAKRHDIHFPDLGNPAVFDEQLTRAEQFGKSMIESINIDTKGLPYRARAFWEAPGKGEAAHFFGPLDEQGFTAEQITDFTTEQKKQESNRKVDKAVVEANEVWAEIKARGCESLYSIAEQFHTTTDAIKTANPGKDLSHLYAGDCILVPSTRYSFRPGGTSIQPEQVKAVPKPVWREPTGPNGEQIGEDINIVDMPTSGH